MRTRRPTRDRLAEAFIRGIEVGVDDPSIAGDGQAMYEAYKSWVTSGEVKPPFIYRNRPDDHRSIDQLHFCHACGGYYGVPHTNSHCQQGLTSRWQPENCACRFCREATGKEIKGDFGVFP